MSDVRAYINPYPPNFSAEWQRSKLSQRATLYTQTKRGKEREQLSRSTRKGSIIEIAMLFLFAKLSGGVRRRVADLLVVVNELLDRGAVIIERATGRTSKSRKDLNSMLVQAREMIGQSARGMATGAKNGKLSKGRPRKAYTEQTLRIIDHFWPPRKGWTVDESVEAINELSTQTVKRGWLYTNRPVRAESN